MSEQTRKKLVFGILILALVWAYFNFTGPKKKTKVPRRTNPTTIAKEHRNARMESGIIPDSLYQEYETKSWGNNPFYNGYRPETGFDRSEKIELHLLGVVFRQYAAQALINNRIVTVGDDIEGFRVTEISRDSVVLINGDVTLTLRVTKESS